MSCGLLDATKLFHKRRLRFALGLDDLWLFGLRREILVRARHTVFVRPTVNMDLFVKVTVRRRSRRVPLHRSAFPRISAHLAASEITPDQVHDEDDLNGAEQERADGTEIVPV